MNTSTNRNVFELQDRMFEAASECHPGPSTLLPGTIIENDRSWNSNNYAAEAIMFGDLHIVKGTMAGGILRSFANQKRVPTSTIMASSYSKSSDAGFIPHTIKYGSHVELFEKIVSKKNKQIIEINEIAPTDVIMAGMTDIWNRLVEWSKMPSDGENGPDRALRKIAISSSADFIWSQLESTPYTAFVGDYGSTVLDSLEPEPVPEPTNANSKRKRVKFSGDTGPPSKRTIDEVEDEAEQEEEQEQEEEEEEEQPEKDLEREKWMLLFTALRSMNFVSRTMIRKIDEMKTNPRVDEESGEFVGGFINGELSSSADFVGFIVCCAVYFAIELASVTEEFDFGLAAKKLFRIDKNGTVAYREVFSKAIVLHYMPDPQKYMLLFAERMFFLYVSSLAPHTLLLRNAMTNIDFVNGYIRPCIDGDMFMKFYDFSQTEREQILGFGFDEVPIKDALELFNVSLDCKGISDVYPLMFGDKKEVIESGEFDGYVDSFLDEEESFRGFTVGALASSRLNYWLQCFLFPRSEVMNMLEEKKDLFRYMVTQRWRSLPQDDRLPETMHDWEVMVTKSTMYPSAFWGTLRSRDFTHRLFDASVVMKPFPTVWDGAPLFPFATGAPELAMAIQYMKETSKKPMHPAVAAIMSPESTPDIESRSTTVFAEATWQFRMFPGVVELANALWNVSTDHSNFICAFLPAVDEISSRSAASTPIDVVEFYRPGQSDCALRSLSEIFDEILAKELLPIERIKANMEKAEAIKLAGIIETAEAYRKPIEEFVSATTGKTYASIDVYRYMFQPVIAVIYSLPKTLGIYSPVAVGRVNALVHFALRFMETSAVGGDDISAPAYFLHTDTQTHSAVVSFCGPLDALFRRHRDSLLIDSTTLSDFSLSATDVADRAAMKKLPGVVWTGSRLEHQKMLGTTHAIWARRDQHIKANENYPLPAVFRAINSQFEQDRVPVFRTFRPGSGEMIDIKRYSQRLVCMEVIYSMHLYPNGFNWVLGPLKPSVVSASVVSYVKWYWRRGEVAFFIHTPKPGEKVEMKKKGQNLHIVDIGLGKDIYFQRNF